MFGAFVIDWHVRSERMIVICPRSGKSTDTSMGRAGKAMREEALNMPQVVIFSPHWGVTCIVMRVTRKFYLSKG